MCLHRLPPRGIPCLNSCLRELVHMPDHFIPIMLESIRSSIASTVAAKFRARQQEHRTLRVVSPTLGVKSRLHLGATTSPRSLQQLVLELMATFLWRWQRTVWAVSSTRLWSSQRTASSQSVFVWWKTRGTTSRGVQEVMRELASGYTTQVQRFGHRGRNCG